MSAAVDLSVVVGRLALRNPILAASGTYGSGVEAAASVDLSRIGGVVTKSVTTKPRPGNPPPRIWETSSGMLNSIGLMNPGLDAFRRDVLPRLAELPCARVVNVAGENEDDFEALTRAFGDHPAVDAIELNVSCPNVAHGLDYGVRDDLLEALVARCRKATAKPLFVKVTPNVADVTRQALAAERGGADAVSAVNTFVGMAVDWRRREPRLGSATGAGGLSGPAVKPLALFAVHRIAKAVRLPILAIGGVQDADDVCDFIATGATAVQVGTQNFVDPAAGVRIVETLEAWARTGALPPFDALRGALRTPRGARPS
ncbi:MAG TPA: dihydroorotate dehydrogenase [Planctomycetota bacterium]|nr:dihydroorotate dehydrogenase [Planctomycetota bacterium]